MPITVQRLRRLEIWSTWVAAGGERVAVVSDANNLVATSDTSLGDKLTFSIPLLSDAGPLLVKGAVLRLDESDTLFDEWKIIARSDDTEPGTMAASITAAPFATTDLVTSGLVSRLDSDGTRVYDFESVGLSPAEQIAQWILPATPAFVALGAITPTDPIDMTYGGSAWDNPLSALQRLAAQTGMELQVRRVGSVGYAIDLVEQIGYDAATADVRFGKNVRQFARQITSDAHATRVFPKGQTLDELAATMAQAVWRVAAVASANGQTVVTLEDPAGGDGPIAFDGQLATPGSSSLGSGNWSVGTGSVNGDLGGLWLRTPHGTTYLMTASDAALQTVTIPMTVPDLAVGDLVDVRVAAISGTGTDLTWLDSPPDLAAWGIVAQALDAGDIPGHRNLVANSALRAWATGQALPDHWSAQGSPAVERQTAAPYLLTGDNALHVLTTADGDGVMTDAVPITPSGVNPYVAAFASVWAVSDPGTVRVELVFTTPNGSVVHPVPPAVASNQYTGQWEDVGVSGEDANASGATAVALRIVQNGPAPAECYIGRAQATYGAAQLPFVEGSGGTQLWQAANERLRTNGAPQVAYDVTLADLAALDPDAWGQDCTLTVGGSVRITDPRFPLAILTRIVQVTRKYQAPGDTAITLSSKPDDLAGSYARPKKKGRLSPSFFAAPGAPVVTAVTAAINTAGNPSVMLVASSDARSMKLVLSTAGMPTDDAVEASAPIAGNQAVAAFPGITVTPGQTIYGKAFAYRNDDGTGLRSPVMPFSVPFAALRRDAPWADGGFALAATDPAGLVANSGVTDSSGLASRKVNLSLAKASQGAPDDLRSVPDGGGYNKATSTYVDATGRVITIARPATGGTLSGDTLGSKTDNLTSTGLAPGAIIADGLTAIRLAKSGGVLFRETFEALPSSLQFDTGVAANLSLLTGQGVAGGNAMRVAGYTWIRWPAIPYLASKLHKMTIRVRRAASPSGGVIYCGVAGVGVDGVTFVNAVGANSTSSQHYVAAAGESPGTTYQEFVGYFSGLGTPAGGVHQPGSAPATLYPGVAYIEPLLIANYPSGGASDLTDVDEITIEVMDETAAGLTFGGFTGVGTIAPSVTQGDGVGGRVMLRGRQSGRCRHGDAVTFSPYFQNQPVIILREGALSEPRNKWGPLGNGSETGAPHATPAYPDFAAENASPSGFTARARLMQKGTGSAAVTDTWSASIDPVTAEGDTATSAAGVLTTTPVAGDTISVPISAQMALNNALQKPGTLAVSLTVAIDVDPASTGAWQQLGSSVTFSHSITGTDPVQYTDNATVSGTVPGLSASTVLRLRVAAYSDATKHSTVSVATNGVHYSSAGTGTQYASKTPDADDTIVWEAYDAALT